MCILNGRNAVNNDFTSISEKGLAVVDYVFVPNEGLKLFRNMEVIGARELFDKAKCVPCFGLSITDHSLLKWDMPVDAGVVLMSGPAKIKPYYRNVYNFF